MKPQYQLGTIKLAPPGAGIPWIQRALVKFLVLPRVAMKLPPEKIRQGFERTTERMIFAAQGLTEEQRQQKVLIQPLQGLEDSSRFWSIDDVFEHLLMVAPAMADLVFQLAQKTPPDLVIDISKVKPGQHQGPHFVRFQNEMPSLMKELDEKISTFGFTSSVTKDHPWFGPMNVKQWYWLLMAHQKIHAHQIQKIIEGLKS